MTTGFSYQNTKAQLYYAGNTNYNPSRIIGTL